MVCKHNVIQVIKQVWDRSTEGIEGHRNYPKDSTITKESYKVQTIATIQSYQVLSLDTICILLKMLSSPVVAVVHILRALTCL